MLGRRVMSVPNRERASNGFPDLHRLRLALGVDRRRLAVLDHAGGGVVGRLLDEDPVDRRGVLQPGGGVDHVSRDQPTLGARARLERDEDLARVDGYPDLELLFLAHPVADREGRPHRALGIVLVRDRGAEDRHHGIADELLDGAAADLQLGPEPVVERTQNRLDVLGVERVRPRGEADKVGEQDAHDLPLPARPAHASSLEPGIDPAGVRCRTPSAGLRHLTAAEP